MVMCTDAKTGMQILQRPYPPQPMAPGHPEKREHESIRHGVRALMASFVVATGQVVWHLGQTRTSEDFATHLANVVHQLPAMQRYDWVVENLQTHWSREVCRLVAQWCNVPCVAQALHRGRQRRAFLSDPTQKHVFHFTPKHGSWLNQVEWWLSVFAQFITFCSASNQAQARCIASPVMGSSPAKTWAFSRLSRAHGRYLRPSTNC
jgi:DDE superfamily endonuclease